VSLICIAIVVRTSHSGDGLKELIRSIHKCHMWRRTCYFTEAPEFILDFYLCSCYPIFSFLCRSLFVLFFFWPLCCLSCELQLLSKMIYPHSWSHIYLHKYTILPYIVIYKLINLLYRVHKS
jgi:hypothetical protein